MRVRELQVAGAFEFAPTVHPDERGTFASPFQERAFGSATGRPLFPVAQASTSRSRRGTVRGIHFAAVPPGVGKYLYCPHGAVVDIVVDLRLGSPTFRRWEAMTLSSEDLRGVYLPLGVGHAFVALEDESIVCYLLSRSYTPTLERTVSVRDDSLGLPIPAEPILSERDADAPTLAEAQAAGLLPDYAACRRLEERWGRAGSRPSQRGS